MGAPRSNQSRPSAYVPMKPIPGRRPDIGTRDGPTSVSPAAVTMTATATPVARHSVRGEPAGSRGVTTLSTTTVSGGGAGSTTVSRAADRDAGRQGPMSLAQRATEPRTPNFLER